MCILFGTLFAIVAFYFLGLERYYCPSADDFSGLSYAAQGVPGFSYANRFYTSWEGPYLSQFLMGLLLWLVTVTDEPALALAIPKVTLVISASVMANAISSKYGLGWSLIQSAILGLLFTVALYLISPSKSEIWHWLIGSVYLLPVSYTLFFGAFIINGRHGMAMIPLAFLMHSRITYALVVLAGIFFYVAIQWFKQKGAPRPWIILSLVGLIFLLIYLAAPGNYVRFSEHGKTFSFMLSQVKLGIRNLILSYNIAKIDRVLAFLVAALPVTAWFGRSRSVLPGTNWQWSVPIMLYFMFVIMHGILFVFVTGYAEWKRVLSFHSFLFLTMVSIYGYWAFGLLSVKFKRGVWPFSFLGSALIVLLIYSGFWKEKNQARELTEEYHSRLALIRRSELGDQDTLYVQPIKYKGVLYFEDFSSDPDNWINKDFVKAYDLNFKVALRE